MPAAVQAYTDAALERFRREWDLLLSRRSADHDRFGVLETRGEENHEIDEHLCAPIH